MLPDRTQADYVLRARNGLSRHLAGDALLCPYEPIRGEASSNGMSSGLKRYSRVTASSPR